MYHDRPKTKLTRRVLAVLAALLAAALLALGAVNVTRRVSADLDDQAAAALKAAVLADAVQCYAVEGAYPESLSHLEQSYGLQWNHKKFIVTYSVFASNVLPDIEVLRR